MPALRSDAGRTASGLHRSPEGRQLWSWSAVRENAAPFGTPACGESPLVAALAGRGPGRPVGAGSTAGWPYSPPTLFPAHPGITFQLNVSLGPNNEPDTQFKQHFCWFLFPSHWLNSKLNIIFSYTRKYFMYL